MQMKKIHIINLQCFLMKAKVKLLCSAGKANSPTSLENGKEINQCSRWQGIKCISLKYISTNHNFKK